MNDAGGRPSQRELAAVDLAPLLSWERLGASPCRIAGRPGLSLRKPIPYFPAMRSDWLEAERRDHAEEVGFYLELLSRLCQGLRALPADERSLYLAFGNQSAVRNPHRPQGRRRLRSTEGRRPGAVTLELPVAAQPFPLGRRPVAPGEPAGDLGLVAYDQAQPSVGAGRPVVLLFWATWCKPCKASLPALAKWATAHKASVIAVRDESRATVTKFLPKFGAFPFVIALDPRGTARSLFTVEATPTFVVLDAGGRLADTGVSYTGEIPLRR